MRARLLCIIIALLAGAFFPTALFAVPGEKDGKRPGGPRPPIPFMWFEVNPGSVKMAEGDEIGHFTAQKDIRVRAASSLPKWEVVCGSTGAEGPDGEAIPAADLFISPKFNPDNPEEAYTGSPISLDSNAVVLRSGPIHRRPLPAESRAKNFVTLQVKTDPYRRPGKYTGRLNFDTETDWIRTARTKSSVGLLAQATGDDDGKTPEKVTSPNSKQVKFSMVVPEYVTFSMDPKELTFPPFDTFPSVVESNEVIHLEAKTNCDLLVTFNVSELKTLDGRFEVPTENVCIGLGRTPQEAKMNTRASDFGTTTLTWRFNPGAGSVYLYCRINVTLKLVAGTYKGKVKVGLEADPSGSK